MRRVTVPEAEAMFGALVSEVEHGETIEIVEDGRVVARLVAPLPMLKKPLDIEGLRAHLATMPIQDESAGDFVSKTRDDDRY